MGPSDQEKTGEIRERLRRSFDRGASAYAAFEAGSAFFRMLLEELLAGAPPLAGKRILDVGCGTGASAEGLLAAAGPSGRVVGLDVSLAMLREARRRLGDRLSLVLMDGCGFARGLRARFDAIVYNAVIFMLPDARSSLRSAFQLLAPGGRVLLSSLEGAHETLNGRPIPDLLAEKGHRTGRHAISPWPTVVEALSELFGTPRVRRVARTLSPAEFLSFYGMEPMSAGLLPALPYADRRKVIEDLCTGWEREGRSVEQVWNLAWARRAE